MVTSFMDECCDLIGEMMPKHKNIICMGDFNIHVNSLNDPDAQQFVALTEALGLSQHVNFTTHNQGSFLDLVFTECISDNKINKITQESYILDDCVVKFTLDIQV